MSEITNNACRLCLNTVQDLEALNVSLRDIIQIVLPHIDCSNNSVICNNCTMLLQKSFSFKSKCLEIEDSIHDFKNDEQDQVNLEKVLGICTDDSSKCIKICRTCLRYLENDAVIELDTENDFKLVIEKCLPEIDVKLTLNPVICQVCENLLKEIYNFISLCDKSNKKIKSYKQNDLCNNSFGVKLTTVTNGNDEIYIISDTENGEEATKKPVKSNIRQRKRKKKRALSETDADDDSDYHYSGSDISSDSSNNDWLSHRNRKKLKLEKRRTKMKTGELDLTKMIFCKYCLYGALTELALDIHISSCPQNPHIKEKPLTVNEIVQAKGTCTEISVETGKENMHKVTVENSSDENTDSNETTKAVEAAEKIDSNKRTEAVEEAEKTDLNKTSKNVEEAEAIDSNEISKAIEQIEAIDSNEAPKGFEATSSSRPSKSVEEVEKVDSIEVEAIETAEETDTNKISNTVEEAETTESSKAEAADSNETSKAGEEAQVTDSNKISKFVEGTKKSYKKSVISHKSRKRCVPSETDTDDSDDDCDYHYVGSDTSSDSSNNDWLSHYKRKKTNLNKQRTKMKTEELDMKKMIFCKYCLYATLSESALRKHIILCPQNPYFKEKPLTINEVVQVNGMGTGISVETKKENLHKYTVTVVNFIKKDMFVKNTNPNGITEVVEVAKKISSNNTSKTVEEAEATDSNVTSKAIEEAEAADLNGTSKTIEEIEATDSNKASASLKSVEEVEKMVLIETEAIEATEETDTNEKLNTVDESETTESNKESKAVLKAEVTDLNKILKAVEETKRTKSNKISKGVQKNKKTYSNKSAKTVEKEDLNKTSKAIKKTKITDANKTTKTIKKSKTSSKKSAYETDIDDYDYIGSSTSYNSSNNDWLSHYTRKKPNLEKQGTKMDTEELDMKKFVEEAEVTDSNKILKAVEETKRTKSNKISKGVQKNKKTYSNKSAKTVEKEDLNKTSKAIKITQITDANKTTKTIKKSKTSSKKSAYETDIDDYDYIGSSTSYDSSNNDWLSHYTRKKLNLEKQGTKMDTEELDIKKFVEEAEVTDSDKILKAVEETKRTNSNKISKGVQKNKTLKAIKKTKITDANKTTKTIKKSKTSSKKSAYETDIDDYDYIGSSTSYDTSNNDWLSHYTRKKPNLEKQGTKMDTEELDMKKFVEEAEITDSNKILKAVEETKRKNSNKISKSVQKNKKTYSNKSAKAVEKEDLNKTLKAIKKTKITDANKTTKTIKKSKTSSKKSAYETDIDDYDYIGSSTSYDTSNNDWLSHYTRKKPNLEKQGTKMDTEELDMKKMTFCKYCMYVAFTESAFRAHIISCPQNPCLKEKPLTINEVVQTKDTGMRRSVETKKENMHKNIVTILNFMKKDINMSVENTDPNETPMTVQAAEKIDSDKATEGVEEAEKTDSNKTTKAVEKAEKMYSNKTSKAVLKAEATDLNKRTEAVEEAEATDSNKTSKAVEEAEAADSNETMKSLEESKKINSIETEAIETAEKRERISNTVEEAEATDSSKSAVEETKQTKSNKISKVDQEAKKTSSNKSVKTVKKNLNKTSTKRTDSNKTTETVKKSGTSSKKSFISDHSLPKDVEIVFNEFHFIEKEASRIQIKNAIISCLHPKGRKVELSKIKEMTIYKEKQRKSIQQAIENNEKRPLPALEVLVCNHCPFNSRSNLKMVLHCLSHSSGSNSRADYAKAYRTVFYCVNCVKSFWTSPLLRGHVTGCSQTDDKVFLLKIGSTLHCAKCYFDTDDMHVALQHLLKCGEINTTP